MKVKICGLTRECDIDYVNEAKPEYIGFVFAKSKRQIDEENAFHLRQKLNDNIVPVGVFVNAPQEQIERIYKNQTISVIQLHGDESPQYVEELKKKTAATIIKAVSIGEEEYTEAFFNTYIKSGVTYFLFDKKAVTQKNVIYGGTGTAFDWSRIPQTSLPYFLAGGLNKENIAKAVSDTRAFAMDISSGVETDGVKDKDKIIEMIRRIRNV